MPTAQSRALELAMKSSLLVCSLLALAASPLASAQTTTTQVVGEVVTSRNFTGPNDTIGVLRFEDPLYLAEIDSVFVTVEPPGGSAKPTGRQFLFAYLNTTR